MTKRTILLNPGPVTLTDRVRQAMARADWCHREPEFARLTQSINARLAGVYESATDEYVAVLLTGSGTAAVEAMLASFAPVDSKTLVAANGVYGERMAAMLTAMGRPMEITGVAWDAPIDLTAVEERLSAGSAITHVVAVHHETTTGRLNEIGDLGALCLKYDCALLLDAVSSFGAEEIRFPDWNLHAVAGTANKCLHGVPGISFVVAQRDLYTGQGNHCGSVYLDLHRYFQAQHSDGYSPFTQAVQVAFALDAALDELREDGGWRKRKLRYGEIANSIRETLRSLNVPTFIPESDYSSVMSSYRLPSGVTYAALHDWLKERGFIVYAGQGHFSDSMFRIAHMGAILDSDVEMLNQALTSFFRDAQ
jgi:2-aminoethylphosphonate-pyruvate transaminase